MARSVSPTQRATTRRGAACSLTHSSLSHTACVPASLPHLHTPSPTHSYAPRSLFHSLTHLRTYAPPLCEQALDLGVGPYDQALVGDKTTAFWMMDDKMYTHMAGLHTWLTPLLNASDLTNACV